MKNQSADALPPMPSPDTEPSGQETNCVSVDVSALAVGEDGKQGVAPGVGESVDFTCTGKVTDVANGQAQITLESVNGQPLQSGGEDEDDEQPGEDDLAGMEAALRGKASAEDDSNQNYV